MRFSSNFGTAIHTLLIIHEYTQTQKVTSDIIADTIGTSPVLIRRLLVLLKKAGFISVAPRKEKAGTTMAKPLKDITLYAVFEAVEPNHTQELHASSIRLGNRCFSGLYTNEIIAGYINITLNSIKDGLDKITLADTLTALEIKEAECPHDNPRELFADNEDAVGK